MHVPGISLAAEQYILLAQESCLTVSITVAGDQPGSGPGFQPWQVCLRNQKLCVTTCPKRLVLLHGLAAQLSIGNGNESSARQDAATTPRRETPSGNDDCATGKINHVSCGGARAVLSLSFCRCHKDAACRLKGCRLMQVSLATW